MFLLIFILIDHLIIQKNSVYSCEKSVEYTEYAEQFLKNGNNKNLNNSKQQDSIVPTFMANIEIEPMNLITLKSKEFELIKLLVNNLDKERANSMVKAVVGGM